MFTVLQQYVTVLLQFKPPHPLPGQIVYAVLQQYVTVLLQFLNHLNHADSITVIYVNIATVLAPLSTMLLVLQQYMPQQYFSILLQF